MTEAVGTSDDSDEKTVRWAEGEGPRPRILDAPLSPCMVLLDRYLVGAELGRGGMGVVYRAVDRQLGRPLAIKVLARHLLSDQEMLARFLAEAKVTAQLQHPSIVPVFELHRIDDGLRFYTMRLVEGRTLDELSRGGWAKDGSRAARVEAGGGPSSPTPGPGPAGPGPHLASASASTNEVKGSGERWTLSRALRILVQVCQAIAYAHAFGVVHRDLKPGNIMVGRFGEVHILDWGLAKVAGAPLEAHTGAGGTVGVVPARLAERSSDPDATPRHSAETHVSPTLTRTGVIMGTPAYMAPEQARGETVDARADIYALGGILYTLLTGRMPHQGTPSQVLYALARGAPPPPPSHVRADVPASLDAICMRALAHEREARTASAGDLARALENWLEGRVDGPVRPDDAEFLSSYRPDDHRRPSVTVDVVVLRRAVDEHERSAGLEVFLHRRARPPFKGCWAIPGTFVRLEDDLETTARLVLVDEMHFAPARAVALPLRQLGAFGEPGRDPRTRVITVAFCGLLEGQGPDVGPDPDEASEQGWFLLEADDADGVRISRQGDPARPEPAFDHARLLRAALDLHAVLHAK